MNDPENFLSRWARRKRGVAKNDVSPADREDAAADAPIAAPECSAAPNPDDKIPNVVAEQKTDEPAFDLASLPSLDSITGETDIRPFLAVGVPASLREAALKRMWMIDPHVREIVDLAEYAWDFTKPGVTGFDLSLPTGDIKRMIADIFGEKPEVDSQKEAPAQAARLEPDSPARRSDDAVEAHRNVTETLASEEFGADGKADASQLENESVRQTLVAQYDEQDAASQKNDAAQESENLLPRPSHGRAMPK
jgi:hypothetical protein